jgi:predicted branched-subunit amino acid permease
LAAESSAPQTAGWTKGATPRRAFLRGIIEAPSVSIVVVIITFVGFGALAHDMGFDLAQAIFVSATVFALPGQVVLADQVGQGLTLAAVFLAVTLTAVRLFPLTASLLPLLRGRNTPHWLLYPLAHVIAVTVWVESTRRLPPIPRDLRVPYYAGFAGTLFLANLIATAIGFALASTVSVPVAAALIFLTPIYFLLALITVSRDFSDGLALGIGFVLGPILFVAVPGFDLALTGLIGGTVAYAALRWRERKEAE